MNQIAPSAFETSVELVMAGHSDTGRRRSHNEDCMLLSAEQGFAIVADGMGGHNAGEVASRIAIESTCRSLTEELATLPSTGPGGGADPGSDARLLRRAIKAANQAIADAARQRRNCEGMGTTLVAAVFRDEKVSIGHVGDSRIYRLREGKLRQLSSDHTVLQEMITQGVITPAEARYAPNRNVVTRALGVAEEVVVDLYEANAEPGDRYLLCSDGLTDMLDDPAIQALLDRGEVGPDKITQDLISKANELGGKDNVTSVIVDIRPRPTTAASWFRRCLDRMKLRQE